MKNSKRRILVKERSESIQLKFEFKEVKLKNTLKIKLKAKIKSLSTELAKEALKELVKLLLKDFLDFISSCL